MTSSVTKASKTASKVLYPACPHCHSPDITAELPARWSYEHKKWESKGEPGMFTCENCGESFVEPVEREVLGFKVTVLETIEYETFVQAPDAEHAEKATLAQAVAQGMDGFNLVRVADRSAEAQLVPQQSPLPHPGQ